MSNDHWFSSKDNTWATPDDFYLKQARQFDFTLDLACTSTDKKTEVGLCFDQGIDALEADWVELYGVFGGWFWCNPPYGRECGGLARWLKKAYEASLQGVRIVMLIPARTDTSYWHDYIFGKARVEFIRGRLKFGSAENSAPFPSALIIYDIST